IFNDHNEFGFAFYNRIISILSKDPQFFLATTAIVTSCLIYPTYKRLCLDPSLMIVLFCTMSTFSMMFSGIRQMLAVGIGFIAYEFTRNKKLVPFIVAVCVAVTFHTSSFMLFFMYPLYHARITKKWLYAVVPAVGFVFIFNRQIFAVLSRFIERYTDYNASMESTGAYTMIILFTLFTVFAFLIPDEAMLDSETIGLRNFLLFSLVLQLFAPLHFIAMRMNYYYIIFIPLLIPKIIAFRSEKWSQVAITGRHIMVIFFLVYFFLNLPAGGNALHIYPYHFFWENVI
ncbi:MAG: EpsG family protein, partial [Clostridia bacterium]|nr:EpsG family protein [Clostridia bacterium]